MSQFDTLTFNEIALHRHHFRLLYGSYDTIRMLLSPSLTPGTFSTWLTLPSNSLLFEELIDKPVSSSVVFFSSTAMAAIATDTRAMTAICASPNAMHSLAASSIAMTKVAASQEAVGAVLAHSAAFEIFLRSDIAMIAAAESSVALSTLASQPSKWRRFKISNTLNAIENPIMLGKNSPYGEASASTEYSTSYLAFKAMDSNEMATDWYSSSGSIKNQWLKYAFDDPVLIHTLTLQAAVEDGTNPKDFRLEYSDDDKTWKTGCTAILSNSKEPLNYDVVASGKHRFWRLFIDTMHTGAKNYLGIRNFKLKGFIW